MWALFGDFFEVLIWFFFFFSPCLCSWGPTEVHLWCIFICSSWGRGVTNIPAGAPSSHPSTVSTLGDRHRSGRCLKDGQMKTTKLNPATVPSLHMLTPQFFLHLCPTKKTDAASVNAKVLRLYCCHPIFIVVSTANSGGQLNGQLFIIY